MMLHAYKLRQSILFMSKTFDIHIFPNFRIPNPFAAVGKAAHYAVDGEKPLADAVTDDPFEFVDGQLTI